MVDFEKKGETLTGTGVDDFAALVQETAPPVSEHTVAAHDAAEAEKASRFADLRDASGAAFDPEIHVTDANGEPSLTKLGKLKRRPGRKGSPASSANTSRLGTLSSAQKTGQAGEPGTATPGAVSPRVAGRFAADALILLGVQIGGEEWLPAVNEEIGLDEKATLEMAFGDYFEAKNIADFPPGVALTIAVLGYAAPRFAKPKTQKRVGRLKGWVARKLAERKLRKEGVRAEVRPADAETE